MKASASPKLAVITGCSSGFGKLMVERFLAAPDWRVLGTTRATGDIFSTDDGRLEVLRLDIADEDGRRKLIERVREQAGGLNCLINNAGYGQAGPLETLTDQQIRAQFEVNFFAPLFLIRDLLPQLRAARGKVINISSVLGFVGMPMQSMYVASKFALEGLSESLHYELACQGVDVTLVEPGGFRTRFAGNLKWPQDSHQSASIYKDQLRGFRSYLEKISTRGKGRDPSVVAELVFALANMPRAPIRRRIGSDSHAVYYLRRSLPECVGDRLFKNIAGKIIEAR